LSISSSFAAAFATGGSSPYRNSVLWLTWGDPSDQPLGAHSKVLGNGSTSTATVQVSDNTTLEYSCTISGLRLTSIGAPANAGTPESRFRSYAPGNYPGDKLDDLYNIGGTGTANRLVNGVWFHYGEAAFRISCTSTISTDGGPPQPHDIRGFVIGDAEATAAGGTLASPLEFVGGAADGTWTIVEVLKNAGTTVPYNANKYVQNGLNYLRFGPGNDATAAVSFLTFNTPSPNAEMVFAVKGGGAQSIAIGVLSPFADYSDAPESYGAAWHIVQEFTLSPDGIPNTTIGAGAVDVNAPSYQPGALVPANTNYLGSKAPDSEQSPPYSADARGDDIFPAFNTTEEDAWPVTPEISALEQGATITRSIQCAGTGTVAGWIDFDINGTFDADERAAALCTGGAAQLSWTAPADIKSGATFVRLRYATVADQIQSATGVADDGEAEDHAITIVGPTLSITKSSNAVNGAWTINQPDAQYQLTVQNDGSIATGTGAEQIVVLDALPPGIVAGWTGPLDTNGWSCSVTGQDVRCETNQVLTAAGTAGSTSIITLPVAIPETFIGTTATNYASVAGGRDPFNDGVPPVPGSTCTDAAHCASHTVTIDWQPELTIEKTAEWDDADGDNLLAINDEITYRFRVTNTGLVTMTNISVTDTLPGLVMTGTPIASLAPGAFDETSYTATYTVTQDDVDAGFVTNAATATGTPPDGSGEPPFTTPPDSITLPPDQTASLTLVKTGTVHDVDEDGVIEAGEHIDYNFSVTNTGATTLTNVTLTDLNLAPSEIAGGPIPSLAAGETDSTTFTALYTLLQEDIDRGYFDNTATVNGKPPGTLPIVYSDPSSVRVPLAPQPGLTILKDTTWPAGEPLNVNDTATYTFRIENTGNVTLSDITVTDELPGIVITGGPITLLPGQVDETTFSAQYTVLQTDVDGGAVTNTATATGTPPVGPPIDSPPSSVTIPPDQTASLAIVKRFVQLVETVAPDGPSAGDVAEYAFDVTNTGSVTLTDVAINENLAQAVISGTIPSLAAGATDSTLTARYALTQADIDAGEVENTAFARGNPPGVRPPVDSPPSTVIEPFVTNPSLEIVKSGTYVDTNGDGYSSAGDTLEYRFEVTNNGVLTMTGVTPVDVGPQFDGIAGEAALSAFAPAGVTLAPGQSQVFTATYVMTDQDAARGAGKADAVFNEAAAQGVTLNGIPFVTGLVPAVLTLPALQATDISVIKVALTRQLRRGEQGLFRIEVSNNSSGIVNGLTLTDTVPVGFNYVENSAALDGVPVQPLTAGNRPSFGPLTINPGQTVALELRVLATASATPGTHINLADVYDPTGNKVTTQAEASFVLLPEAVFDCSEIIGKVFDDRNENGYQDSGEIGLPAIRLVTARGVLITTDKHGRYSIPCAAIPDAHIGSNFILKLDERTLPTGFSMTTENPEVVRLTAGKMAELNFGASLGREVSLDLDGTAFLRGAPEMSPDLVAYLPTLVEILGQQRTTLRLTYRGDDSDLSQARIETVEDAIRSLWKQRGNPYALSVETGLELR